MDARPLPDPDAGAPPDDAAGLRLRAQAGLAARAHAEIPEDRAGVERLVHELGVHQIELELQNEALRRVQEALEASRDRYVDLYDHAPVAYVTFAPSGVIARANRRAAQLFNEPHADRLVGQRIADRIAYVDRARFQKLQHGLLGEAADGAPQAQLQLAVPPGASARWAAVQMSLMYEPGGAGVQVRAAFVDVTDRVRLQTDLARLAAIVESSDDAIVGRDLEGAVTSWNAAAARLFGVPAADMLGHTMAAQVPRERVREEIELLRRLRRGERVQHFETERTGAGGRRLAVSISLSPVLDDTGRVAGSAMIARDIAARRDADRALAHRLRQLDVLARAGQALIMGETASSPAGDAVFRDVARAAGCDLHWRYEPAAVGADGPALRQVGGAGASVVETLSERVAASGAELVVPDLAASALEEAVSLRLAGARCYAGFPLAAQGRAYGVAAFASTAHDALGEGDLQMLRSVCAQVSAMLDREQLLRDLHDRELSLQQADRAKDEFIATLAHELRNPLAPIRNALAILQRSGSDDAQRMAWCRDVIDRQVGQMTRLLEDLLDVSRVTCNKIELRRERLDLMRAVEQAVETTRPLIEAQGHRLRLEPPDEALRVYGDLTRLTQVFANLLNNAAKYTDAGGEIGLSVRRAGAGACIVVRDNGIGIDAAQLPRVFEMFAQLGPAADRSGGGLGIGLALTRALVELHGGSIRAASAGVGQGSEFVVRLPASADGPRDAPGARAGDAAAPPVRRVLVVDDNVDAGQSMAELLSLHGQDVRVARGGVEGLALAGRWRPEIALLDIGMPDLNGYELCRRIRAEPWGRDIVLVACTGWGQPDDRARAKQAGFDHHFVKPVDTQALLDLLADPSGSSAALH